jgi:transaldolase
MSRLHDLHDAGQSVWFDFIRRDMIGSGELARLVTDGIRGVTSNPSIFQNAIDTSDQYDDQIRHLVAANPEATVDEIFEELAVADIQGAADILRPVYDDADGDDGFVSLEVSPLLAADTAGTIEAAKRLWRKVDRPNLMVKVPATPEGIPAIEELIAAGININVTLLFALSAYEDAAHAYMRGLARASDPTSISSVASFFVSRVDSNADGVLDKIGSPEALELRGKVAVANAKLAYRTYQAIFEGPAFAAELARGARPQRCLWASTSTKNPAYSDVLYVDTLIGPNTVNTLPPATVDSFIDHGTIDGAALGNDATGAEALLQAFRAVGGDIDAVTDELLEEGVRKFADAYVDMLDTLRRKIETITG